MILSNVLPLASRSVRVQLLACLLLISFAAGCRSRQDNPLTAQDAAVTTTIAGRVTDEAGAGLGGVTVTSSGKTAITDASGLFSLPNVSATASHAFVIAKKASYFNGARAAVPTVNGVTYMELSLAASTVAGTINGAAGGTVTATTGATLTLPAGGVVTSTGAPYTGTVSVSMRHLIPSDPNFANLFTGDMTGRRADGSEAELGSFGVILAELRGTSGEVLQPASGKPATLSYPIVASLQSRAPATVPLWYFDEALGMWKEEGSATKSGSTYTGTVQHFSSWNCDWSGPWGLIKGRIVCGGVAIPNVVVSLGALIEGGQPMVVTNGAGEFKVRVPAAANFVELQVIAANNKGIYYTNNAMKVNAVKDVTTDLGDIALDSKCPSYLPIALKDCGGNSIDGMIVATWPGGMSYGYSQGGSLQLVAPASTPLTLTATAASGDVAQPQMITAPGSGEYSVLTNLVACNGASDIRTDINGSFDGSALKFSPDGKTIATIAKNGLDLVLLDVATGNTVRTIPNVFSTGNTLKLIDFSNDGSKLLTFAGRPNGGSGFDVWKIDGTRLTPSSIASSSECFTADGKRVYYYNGSTFNVYDIAAKTSSVSVAPADYNSTIVGLTPSGNQMVTIGYITKTYQHAASVWDFASGTVIKTIPLSSINRPDSGMAMSDTKLSGDGKALAVIAADGIHFFDIASGAEVSSTPVASPYDYRYDIATDHSSVIAQYRAGAGNTVGLFSTVNGVAIHTFSAPGSLGVTTNVALSRDGTLAAAMYASTLRVWNVK